MPHCKRDHVVETLVHEGGIGHETHVGEFIVCKECENCVVVMVVCTQARAGELMNVLTRAGVGVAFGTITSIPVASQRPNPVALVGEFKELKAKVEAQAEEDLGKDRQFQRKWNRRKARLEKHKIEYVTTSTTVQWAGKMHFVVHFVVSFFLNGARHINLYFSSHVFLIIIK